MALNIKDPETVALAAEVADLAGETKTRAVKVALQDRRKRLRRRGPADDRAERLRRFFEEEVWPQIPKSERGKRLTREEWDDILGYGPEGF